MFRRLLLAPLMLLLPLAALAAEPHSYAQPDQVQVKHIDLDLVVDFGKKALGGTATLDLDWKNRQATQLVLDTRDLHIDRIEAVDANGKITPLKYTLAAADKALGRWAAS